LIIVVKDTLSLPRSEAIHNVTNMDSTNSTLSPSSFPSIMLMMQQLAAESTTSSSRSSSSSSSMSTTASATQSTPQRPTSSAVSTSSMLTPCAKLACFQGHCDDTSCAVCLSPFKSVFGSDPDLEPTVTTKCNHTFHDKCLKQAKLKKSVCPLCRTTLTPPVASSIRMEHLTAEQHEGWGEIENVTSRLAGVGGSGFGVTQHADQIVRAASRGRNAVR
jgi:Ring finger domain